MSNESGREQTYTMERGDEFLIGMEGHGLVILQVDILGTGF